MRPQPGSRFRPITVIGVGNDFRRDDGVGPAIVSRIERRTARAPLPDGTVLRTCDGEPMGLVSLWEHAHAAIVVDAARTGTGSPPGHVSRLAAGATRVRSVPGGTSSHGLGLAAAIELAHVLGRLPAQLIVYTVEVCDLDVGVGLSVPVDAAVEPASRRVEREIRRLARTDAARGPR